MVNYKLPDFEKVLNPPHNYVEVDVFQLEPTCVVAECTTFLKKSEMSKVQKFIKVVEYLRNRSDKNTKAFFICLTADNRIERKAKELLESNEIIFICRASTEDN
jgi:hypothetical protein